MAVITQDSAPPDPIPNKPNLSVFGRMWQEEQKVLDWLDTMRLNARTVHNEVLARQCEHAMARIETLVRNLFHAGSQP